MKVSQILEWSKPTPKSIIDHLKELGYKKLGNGVDQTAFLAPDGNVFKVFNTGKTRLPSGFSKDHMMFKQWVTYCEKRPSNIFLPKFYGWESFKWEEQFYLQIKMERLAKLPSPLARTLETLADTIRVYTRRGPAEKLKLENFYKSGEIDHILGQWIDKSTKDEFDKLLILLGKNDFVLLAKTIADLADIADKSGYTLDLHGGNFMHRNDGVPIIVDPWVVR